VKLIHENLPFLVMIATLVVAIFAACIFWFYATRLYDYLHRGCKAPFLACISRPHCDVCDLERRGR